MKLQHRCGITLLALLLSTGCTYWQPQNIGPRDVLTGSDVDQVRLTRTNGELVVVRVAEVRGDSIYGTPGSTGSLTCDRASEACGVRIPISEVGFVELRRFSPIKTAALVLVPVGAFVVVFLSSGSCSGPSTGAC
jgi:hypothetical protein